MGGKVGLTTTVPVEVIYASGRAPVDLNNVFINSGRASEMVIQAEREGLPATVCAWVKGIYRAALEQEDIDTVVAVVEGDCSNTHALVELWKRKGKRVIPFAYPFGRERDRLAQELERFERAFGVKRSEVEEMRGRLEGIRAKLRRLDDMTWREGRVSGAENHVWLVSASDFNGDPARFERDLDVFLAEASRRPTRTEGLRLGYAGVPTVISDFYEVMESHGVRMMFNEMSRQFAMLEPASDIVEQYRQYTYPYEVDGRLEDIGREVKRRGIKGLVHYVQSFCFRQMEHGILSAELDLPVLRLEGDRPGPMDGRTRTRLEGFLEMLT